MTETINSKKDKDFRERSDKTLINFILTSTAKYYGMKMEDYKEDSRKREIVTLKQTAAYFIRKNVRNIALSSIGQLFNNLDHATILYGTRNIAKLAEVDKETRFAIAYLEKEITEYNEKIKIVSLNKDAIIQFEDVIVIKMFGGRNIALSGLNAEDNNAAIDFFRKFDQRLEVKRFKDTGMYVIDESMIKDVSLKDNKPNK